MERRIHRSCRGGLAACLALVSLATRVAAFEPPVLPPLPLQPPNGGTTSEPFVVWTWFMPPSTAAGEPLVCDLRVAEIVPPQSPEEALRLDPPVLVREGLRTSAWQTSDAARRLHSGRTYAWRLIAKRGGQVVAESEVWTFTYLAPEAAPAANAAAAPYAAGTPAPAATAPAAPAGPRPVEWHAAARATVESANRPGTLSGRPAGYARLQIDPTLALYGSPLAMSVLLSTEKDPQRAQLQRGTLGFAGGGADGGFAIRQRLEERIAVLQKTRAQALADTLRAFRDSPEALQAQLEQLQALRGQDPTRTARELEALGVISAPEAGALRLPAIGFGSVTPRFEPQFLSGVTLNGGSIEYGPGRAYGALALGKLPRGALFPATPPVVAPDGGVAQLEQDLYAARAGWGRALGSHVIASGLWARDDAPTRQILALANPARAPHPQQDVVAALAARAVGRAGARMLDAELEGSLFDGGADGALVPGRPVPASLRGAFGEGARTRTVADWAGSVRGALASGDARTRLVSGLRFTGPGYVSAGAPNQRRDVLQFDGGLDRASAGGGLTLGARAALEQSGVMRPQDGNARTRHLDARASAKLPAGAGLELSWSHDAQAQQAAGAASAIDQHSDLAAARLRAARAFGRVRSLTLLAWDRLAAASSDASGRHDSDGAHLTEMLALPSGLAVLGRGSHTRTHTALADGPDADVWAWEGSLAWDRSASVQASAGVQASASKTLHQRGGFVSATVALGRLGAVELEWTLTDARAVRAGVNGFTDRIARIQFLSRGAAPPGAGSSSRP